MSQHTDSRTVRAGGTTYFFDIKESREGKPYLVITASRFKGENSERERDRIVVFPDHAQKFLEATGAMIGRLG